MSFGGNQQQQQPGAYSPAAPAQASTHYATTNHRHSGQQHSYSAPNATQHQQWGSYAASPGPSPVMGSPSPAPASNQRSSNPPQSTTPQAPMSGPFSQGSAAQSSSGHWQGHQAHTGHAMHQGSNHNMVATMSPPPTSMQSQNQYYQPPNSQAASPQQLDLSCTTSMQPVDLHSPGTGMHSPSPTGPWPRNPSGGGPNSSGGGGGGSSPLASLQMLVNQDMNRQATAAYPPNSQGMVDLSMPRGNTPHQTSKPEELRNGNASATTSSPPALNGDLSSGADSGISSPMTTHLHPPDKHQGPRISVKSPQRLAAEVERQVRAQQRTTPSPHSPFASDHNTALNLNKVQASLSSRLQVCEALSEPESSPSPREARTKASVKRSRKVDAILENLVESGTKKKRAASPPTIDVPIPVICVPPSEDSGMEVSTSCPNSPNKAASRSRSPASREDTVSPAFDDASQDSKPRRKRKPDNPTRLKSPEEGKTKADGVSEEVKDKSDLEVAITAPAVVEVQPSSSVNTVADASTKPADTSHTNDKEKSSPNKVGTQDSSVVDLSVKPTPNPIPETKVDDNTSGVSSLELTPPPVTSENKSEPKTAFIEVENELAKMFEGIESDTGDKVTATSNDSLSQDVKSDNEPQPGPSSAKSTPSKGKRGRPKGKRELSDGDTPTHKKQKKAKKEGDTPKKKRSKSKIPIEDEFIPELPSSSNKKKKKRKSDGKGVKSEDRKKNAQDTPIHTPVVERCRGPYVRIEGPKDMPTNVAVFNSSRGDDEDGERPAAAPALKYNRKKLSWHNEKELRNRVQGLGFSSTMASHYDAFTADESWRCAFCKRGSHSEGLGDLFGPYFIQQEKTEASQVASQAEDTKKKKKRRKLSSEEKTQKSSRKSKNLASVEPSRGDVTEVPGPWEVWVHEPCAIWAAGVHLVGAHMVGLQEAVWGAANSMCQECGQTGANLGCVRRTCDERAHYNCALNLGWQLDEEGYVSCCPAHMRGSSSGTAKRVLT